MNNLIFAVVGGSLVGVALGMGIVLLNPHSQVFAGLDNVKRSVAGLFTPAKKSIPPNVPPQADAAKPVGERYKNQPAPPAGSEPAGGETSGSGAKKPQ
jgi:hypothetical protein